MPKLFKFKKLRVFAISSETMEDEVDFLLQINMKVFYKLIIPFWVFVTRHTQIYQNNKFAISFQYLRENIKEEVDSLPIGKH